MERYIEWVWEARKKENTAVLALLITSCINRGKKKRQRRSLCQLSRKRSCSNKSDSQIYMRLPGQQITVKVTLFLCSFSMGTSAEWLIPTVDSPFTATIISPHLKTQEEKGKIMMTAALQWQAHTNKQHFTSGVTDFYHAGSVTKKPQRVQFKAFFNTETHLGNYKIIGFQF